VGVTAGTRYTLGGRVLVPFQTNTGVADIGVIWYSTPDCKNSFISSSFSSGVLGRTVGKWFSAVVNVAAPPGAVTAAVVIENWPDAGTSFKTYFDNLFFDIERPLSINGFSPALGVGGTLVSIAGNDLYGATAVKFNG